MRILFMIFFLIGILVPEFYAESSSKPAVYEKPALIQLLRENPNDLETILRLARLYRCETNYQKAADYYRKGLSVSPDDPALYCELGQNWLDAQRPDLSLEVLTNAASYFTRNPRIHSLIGISWYKMGKFEKALEEHKAALGNSTDSRKNDFYFVNLAKCYRELKNYPESREYFEKSLRLKENPWTYYEFGKLFEETAEWDKAVWAYQKARAFAVRVDRELKEVLFKKLAYAEYEYGMNLKEAGKTSECKRLFEKILQDRDLCRTPSAERAGYWLKRI